jgi:trehalose-phosphatase
MILPGKNVLEFLPRVNWGKGEAVLWIRRRLARTLRSRRIVTLYAGDDATDEAAFATLQGRGVTIRVGAHRGRADYAVKNVREIHALLRWIARATG